MKLVHLLKRPLTARDRQRFGIDHFRARGDDIAVLDMSALLHPDLPDHMTEPAAAEGIELRRVASWREFRAAEPLLAQADAVFMLIQSFGLSSATLRPLRSLKRAGTPYLTLAPNVYPRAAANAQEPSQRLRALGRRIREAEPGNSILSRLPPGLLGVEPARWHVVNGMASRRPNGLVGPQTTLIETGSQDFDIWLDLRQRRPEVRNEAVFIDQFMPHHPDAEAAGRGDVLDPSTYYASLRAYFDWLEKTLSLTVTIAAHPRADYSQQSNPFGGRQITRGKSPELIADSRLVLAHHSTALGLAVLFRKPAVILTSDALMGYITHHRSVYLGFAEALQAPLVYLDRPDTWAGTEGTAVDESIYRRYETRFIRGPGTPERKMWEIVADAIS